MPGLTHVLECGVPKGAAVWAGWYSKNLPYRLWDYVHGNDKQLYLNPLIVTSVINQIFIYVCATKCMLVFLWFITSTWRHWDDEFHTSFNLLYQTGTKLAVIAFEPDYCSLALWIEGNYFKRIIFNSLYGIIAWALAVKLLSGECHRPSIMRSQHWFK